MTVQCEAAAVAQVHSSEDATRRMKALMHRLSLDSATVKSLSPKNKRVLKTRLEWQLRIVEEAGYRDEDDECEGWMQENPAPQPITGPSPGTLAARGQRPVGTRSA